MATLGKLGGPIAHVHGTAQPGHDPLPHVAAQTQDQVADAVLEGMGTPPHLFRAQLLQALGEPRLDEAALARGVEGPR